jgi:hypothetical protein
MKYLFFNTICPLIFNTVFLASIVEYAVTSKYKEYVDSLFILSTVAIVSYSIVTSNWFKKMVLNLGLKLLSFTGRTIEYIDKIKSSDKYKNITSICTKIYRYYVPHKYIIYARDDSKIMKLLEFEDKHKERYNLIELYNNAENSGIRLYYKYMDNIHIILPNDIVLNNHHNTDVICVSINGQDITETYKKYMCYKGVKKIKYADIAAALHIKENRYEIEPSNIEKILLDGTIKMYTLNDEVEFI